MSIPNSTHLVGQSSETCQSPLQKSSATPVLSTAESAPVSSPAVVKGPRPVISQSSVTERHILKGTHAKFLYENPRFINEPIMHLLPQESSQSVGECMNWSVRPQREVSVSTQHTASSMGEKFGGSSIAPDFSTSQRSSYSVPESSSYKLMRKKSHGHSNPIIPNFAVKCQEKISFRHDYNSRVDPNEPPRGKLHGNFVWGKVANQDDHHQNS